MKLHKYCALLPRMMADEYQTLKADIKAHGLLEPIVAYEDSMRLLHEPSKNPIKMR